MPEEKDTLSPKPQESSKRLRPTVIRPPEGETRPSAAKGHEEPRPKRPVGPTMIPGIERKRIQVSDADLKSLSPAASSKILGKAARSLQAFVVEEATDRSAILWGHRLQQDYSDLVSQTLSLLQADVLQKVTGYVGRMMQILGSIDLEAVYGVAASSGGIGQYLKRVNKRIDTPQELEVARIELDQLVKLMSAALDQLLALKEEIEQHASRIDEIGDEVEASALAAEFLSVHLRDRAHGLSQRFLERSMSLTQTLAQIRGSGSLRQTQAEQPLRLIGAIQNVALVMIPAWLGSIAALVVMEEAGRKPTPTQAGELAYQLRDILQQLEKRK